MSVVIEEVLFRLKRGRLLASAVLTVALMAPWVQSQAVPFTTDITIGGTIDFYDSRAEADGVSQHGDYWVKEGGVTTTNVVNGTAVTGGRPLTATLTQAGDGFGISAGVDSVTPGAASEFPVDIDFSIRNSSLSAIYQVRLQFDYDHSVDAGGGDAYAISMYRLFDFFNSQDLILRGVVSDAVLGDHMNGPGLGTFGELVADSGSLFVDLILNPGELLNLVVQYDMGTGILSDPGSVMARFSSFLSVASVVQVERATIPVPAPFMLLLAGGLGLLVRRRKS